MGPYKCPDCGIWWAGFEHQCRISSKTSNSVNWGHCHGCITARCSLNDHTPCMLHEGGWSINTIDYGEDTKTITMVRPLVHE